MQCNQANLKINTITQEEKNIFELKSENNFDMNINYLDENPFTNYMDKGVDFLEKGFGLSVMTTTFGYFSGALASSTLNMLGSLCGVSLIGLGLLITIPALIGSGGYQIYKSYKENNCKDFFEELINLKK